MQNQEANMNHSIMKTLAGMALGLTLITTGTVAGFGPAQVSAATAASVTASDVIATGQKFMGVPYQWGAKSGRTDRFDCSSFVQYSFASNGIKLPRSSKQQSGVGTFVPRSQLQPGDLVFFYSPIHHVAIYMGNGKILHTYGSPGVTISDLNTGNWNRNYTTARRVLAAGQAVPAPKYQAPYAAPAKAAQPAQQAKAPVKTKKPTAHVHHYNDDHEGGHED
jgi:lipoprotein Spr